VCECVRVRVSEGVFFILRTLFVTVTYFSSFLMNSSNKIEMKRNHFTI
jgi:hypothetical protein